MVLVLPNDDACKDFEGSTAVSFTQSRDMSHVLLRGVQFNLKIAIVKLHV